MGHDAQTPPPAEPALTEATAHWEDDMGPSLAGPLARLGAEADLLEQLLAHIAEQRDQARAGRERLERSRTTIDDADRASNQVLIAAQAAALKSRLTRLQTAASLAKEFAQLRASEADSLKLDPRRPDASGSENDAAPDRDVLSTDADDSAQERVFRRAS
jgi:hypothetical protein